MSEYRGWQGAYPLPEEEPGEGTFEGRKTPAHARIYSRDGGVCHVCALRVPFDYYECGHIVDVMCGGSTRDSNLVVMCRLCNQRRKPLHDTRAEYLEWLATSPTVTRARKVARVFQVEIDNDPTLRWTPRQKPPTEAAKKRVLRALRAFRARAARWLRPPQILPRRRPRKPKAPPFTLTPEEIAQMLGEDPPP